MSKLQVDTIVDKEDVSAPTFSKGAIVTGVTTSTTFSGNLTGDVTGTLTGTASGLAGSPDITVASNTVGKQLTAEHVNVTGVSTLGGGTTMGDSVVSYWGTGGDLQIYHNGTHSYISDAGTGSLIILADDFYLQDTTTASMIQATEGAQVQLHYNGNKKIETTNTGVTVTGTVAATNANITGITTASSFSDSLGTLRSLPVNSQGSAYELVSTDAGKLIKITTGGVTCPNGAGFSAGDMISIMNESGSNQTITEAGGATLYWTADGTTGNRTLGPRGVATIVMSGSSAFYISGSGLS